VKIEKTGSDPISSNFAPQQRGSLVPSPIGREVLGAATEARVALGRAGPALPTAAQLAFVGDHARARDAVWTPVDFDALAQKLEALGLATLRLHSEAPDRATYLRRPDLGRRLDADSQARLSRAAAAPRSRIVLVIADGLSAEAVHENAGPVVEALVPRLAEIGTPLESAILVEQGRVAVGDPIGETLGAELVVLLVGERPGLSAADSLGCYVTYAPRPGTPDSKRNCLSNIRRGGLAPLAAAKRIARLAERALAQRGTGIELKEEEVPALESSAESAVPK
jgi:ethanolamine ammonia-lyase small subunit